MWGINDPLPSVPWHSGPTTCIQHRRVTADPLHCPQQIHDNVVPVLKSSCQHVDEMPSCGFSQGEAVVCPSWVGGDRHGKLQEPPGPHNRGPVRGWYCHVGRHCQRQRVGIFLGLHRQGGAILKNAAPTSSYGITTLLYIKEDF